MNNTEKTEINDLVEQQSCYESKQKIFEYIEIDHNLYLESEYQKDYCNWLKNCRNDNFWARSLSRAYGSFIIEIYVKKKGSKKKLFSRNINKILNKYGSEGYEIIDVRCSEDKGSYPKNRSSYT